MAAAATSEERFHDYTIATAFEKLVASIESCLTTWRDKELGRLLSRHAQQRSIDNNANQQPRLQAQVLHRLPFRSEPYSLALHLPPLRVDSHGLDPHASAQQAVGSTSVHAAGSRYGQRSATLLPIADCSDLLDAPHRLQQWFGAPAFLLLTPDSYSGRVLESEEAHTLLSAAAVALSHARIAWPLLVPVHDAVRDSYRGVAALAGGSTLMFETDSLHSSRLPAGLLQLDQQLLLFARQLAAGAAPAAAAACREALGAELDAVPASMAADAAVAGAGSVVGAEAGAGAGLRVAVAARHSYVLPGPGDDADVEGSSAWGGESASSGGGGDGGGGGTQGGEWDEAAPWRPWAAQADPIGCLELDVVWHFRTATEALHAISAGADEPAPVHGLDPAQAAEWRLLALSSSYERDSGRRGFVLRPVDKPRRFLRLQSLTGQRAQCILEGTADIAPALLPGDSSFFGMLLTMLESCKWVARAPSLGSLASAGWWPQQGTYLPPMAPDWVLQEAVRDIFQMPILPVWPGMAGPTVAWPTSAAGEQGCLGKAAPLGALISRFTLHALALGSPRSVAELWSRFVSTLRLAYWDRLSPLPRMRLGQQQQQHVQVEDQADGRGVSEGPTAAASPGGDRPEGNSSRSRPEVPALDCCLLHQKLQLLDLCIHLLQQQQQQQQWESPGKQFYTERQQFKERATVADAAADAWGSFSDEAPSPGSSTSSYHSAAAGSEMHLSPEKEQQAAADACAAQQAQANASPTRLSAAAAAPRPPGEDHPGAVVGALQADGATQAEGAVSVLSGVFLQLHPDRPLHVPAVQQPPPQTEDLLAEERQAAAQPLAEKEQDIAAALRARLEGRMLLSDMQAFKAANPGCCLLDFVRWHSPKDCCQAQEGHGWQLSGRMAAEGNAWKQLWEAAAPVPACRQRPLFDAQLEGERALHFLETLPPSVLFSELLAVGFSAAVQLLASAGTASGLPSVRRQLGSLAAAAGPLMQQGVAAVATVDAHRRGSNASSAAAAAAGLRPQMSEQDAPAVEGGLGPPAVGSTDGSSARFGERSSSPGSIGGSSKQDGTSSDELCRLPSSLRSMCCSALGTSTYHRLLLLLGCTEQAVVAAQSLLLRLQHRTLGPSGDGSSEGMNEFDVSAADGLIAAALGERPYSQLPHQQLGALQAPPAVAAATCVALARAQWPDAEVLLRGRHRQYGSTASDDSSSEASGLGEPFQQEWLLQVATDAVQSKGDLLAPAERTSAAGMVLQRMYVKALPAEVRVATVIGSEAC